MKFDKQSWEKITFYGKRVIVTIFLLGATATLLVIGDNSCRITRTQNLSYIVHGHTFSNKCLVITSPKVPVRSTNFLLFSYNTIQDNPQNYVGGIIVSSQDTEAQGENPADGLIGIIAFPGTVASPENEASITSFNEKFPRSDLFPLIRDGIVVDYKPQEAEKTLYITTTKYSEDEAKKILNDYLVEQKTSLDSLLQLYSLKIVYSKR